MGCCFMASVLNTLCYYAREPLNDTSFRRSQVTVDRPGAKIRARWLPSGFGSVDSGNR